MSLDYASPYDKIVYCGECFRPEPDAGYKLPKCGQCKFTHYCDRVCQRKNWPKHKKICAGKHTGESTAAPDYEEPEPIDADAQMEMLTRMAQRVADQLRRDAELRKST